MIDKKINDVIINYKKNRINRDMALLKLDNLLKNDIKNVQYGKKRIYKKKIFKLKKIIIM